MSDTRWSAARADALKALHSAVKWSSSSMNCWRSNAESGMSTRSAWPSSNHGQTGNWHANCSVESGALAISTVQYQSAVSQPIFEHGMRHLPVAADRGFEEATTDVGP